MLEIMGVLAFSMGCNGINDLVASEELDTAALLQGLGVSSHVILEPVFVEDTWERDGFCYVSAISNDLARLSYLITKDAGNTRFYAAMMTDYGTEFYFAHDGKREGYAAKFDPEADEPASNPRDEWLQRVPPDIVEQLEMEL